MTITQQSFKNFILQVHSLPVIMIEIIIIFIIINIYYDYINKKEKEYIDDKWNLYIKNEEKINGERDKLINIIKTDYLKKPQDLWKLANKLDYFVCKLGVNHDIILKLFYVAIQMHSLELIWAFLNLKGGHIPCDKVYDYSSSLPYAGECKIAEMSLGLFLDNLNVINELLKDKHVNASCLSTEFRKKKKLRKYIKMCNKIINKLLILQTKYIDHNILYKQNTPIKILKRIKIINHQRTLMRMHYKSCGTFLYDMIKKGENYFKNIDIKFWFSSISKELQNVIIIWAKELLKTVNIYNRTLCYKSRENLPGLFNPYTIKLSINEHGPSRVKKLIKSFVVNHKACKMALKIIKYVKSS